MKKVNYLLLVMFAVVLISTSCEEDEQVMPKRENQITEEMLVGDNWVWVSFEFIEKTYESCDYDLYLIYDWTTLNLEFNELRVDMNSKCAWGEDEFNVISATYEIDDNLLIIADNAYVFEILSTYEEVENGTLILKWVEGYSSRLPIGGVHTLVNQ